MTSAELKNKLLQEIELISENELDKMRLKQLIKQKIDNLSEDEQKKVLNFVDFLQEKSHEIETKEWNQFSLEQAMRDLEDNNLPEYTEADLVEKWQ